MAKTLTQPEMAAWDAGTFEVMKAQAQVSAARDGLFQAAHRMAGDKKQGYGRSLWLSSDGEVLATLGDSGDPKAAALLARIDETHDQLTALNEQVEEREAFWLANGQWSRYFPCLNRDGHIHSSLRHCPTVRWDTDMGWAVEMSGLTPGQAIHEGVPGQFPGLGETLCTVCFPEAPAEWCRTRSEVTRAEREAAKAAKNAARAAADAVKNLAEAFVTYDGDKVKTVAAAKALVREAAETEVELEWNRTGDGRARWNWNQEDDYRAFVARLEHRLAGQQADAAKVSAILLAREDALPGSGWTREDAAKTVATAARRARRAYFG